MNLARALTPQSGNLLVAVNCGRAHVMSGVQDDLIITYHCGERAYVARCDSDSPEAVRIADSQPLGRVNLRNWEPVTLCETCLNEFGEHELKECNCGARLCVLCADNHPRPCGSGFAGNDLEL